MIKLKNLEIEKLEPGTPVVINLKDEVSDIGVFLAYNKITRKAIVADCLFSKTDGGKKVNVCEYEELLVFPQDKESLIKMY